MLRPGKFEGGGVNNRIMAIPDSVLHTWYEAQYAHRHKYIGYVQVQMAGSTATCRGSGNKDQGQSRGIVGHRVELEKSRT